MSASVSWDRAARATSRAGLSAGAHADSGTASTSRPMGRSSRPDSRLA